MGRDRRLDELASIEFTGSLGEAFGRYAYVLRDVAMIWDIELGMASTDVRAALTAMRAHGLGLDAATRRIKARRVARRLRRAQALIASVTKRAEQFPKEYAKQFLTPEVARKATEALEGGHS